MNTRWKKSGVRLLVCGSLLASIALIAIYQPSGGNMSQPSATVNSNEPTADGYYTGPLRQMPLEGMERKSQPIVTDWHTDIPALQKKVTMHLSDADLGIAITTLAKMTGLNFACMDMGGQGRLSLQMHNVAVWQVMQALADSCGGTWQRDHDLFTLRLKGVVETNANTLAPARFAVRAAVPV